MRFSNIGLACVVLGGCVSMNPGLGGGLPCEVTADHDLLLRGDTTEPMLACVGKIGATPVKRVILDSNGGPVAVALQIGDLLAGYRAEMLVRGQCNSACANYFLPVAWKITVEPGSAVLLHGSIDEGFLAQAGGDPATSRETYEAQMDYAQRHAIPRGWLLMRDAEDVRTKRGSKFTAGEPAMPFIKPADARAVSVKAVLVEEGFMRSCLRGVEIVPFDRTMSQRVYTEQNVARVFAKQGIFPSGSMVCVPETIVISDPIKPPLIPPIAVEPPDQGRAQE